MKFPGGQVIVAPVERFPLKLTIEALLTQLADRITERLGLEPESQQRHA
jgi:hypothetical protein